MPVPLPTPTDPTMSLSGVVLADVHQGPGPLPAAYDPNTAGTPGYRRAPRLPPLVCILLLLSSNDIIVVDVASPSRSICLCPFHFLIATSSGYTSSRPCCHMLRRLRGLAELQYKYCTHIRFSLLPLLHSISYLLPLQKQVFFLSVAQSCLL